MLFGVISSIALVIVSPKVWPGADTVTGLADRLGAGQPGHRLDPARVPRLLARHACSRREHGAERTYHELFVRSETGLGAEKALAGH